MCRFVFEGLRWLLGKCGVGLSANHRPQIKRDPESKVPITTRSDGSAAKNLRKSA
jgi:hypothetical protein